MYVRFDHDGKPYGAFFRNGDQIARVVVWCRRTRRPGWFSRVVWKPEDGFFKTSHMTKLHKAAKAALKAAKEAVS